MPPERSSRGRPRQPLTVPDLASDAAERKRALNVLAQRRYRARKRESKAASGRAADKASSTRQESQETNLTRQSPRTEYSSDQEIFNPSSNASDGDFGSWDPQAMQMDLPLDIDWSLLADSSSVLATDSSSEGSLISNFAPPDFIAGPLLQDYEVASTTFADTYLLPIPALALLGACLTIATRLGIAMLIWDCDSISPFYLVGHDMTPGVSRESSVGSSNCSTGLEVDILSLPENLRPTRTQRLLPHHPLLDLLPWPTVRDKLIMCFSQPTELRPARVNMENLIEDLEDEAEGVVVKGNGDGPWDAASWEIGRAFENRWWFVLDSKVKRRR